VFFITRWETLSDPERLVWRKYVKLTRLKIWKLVLILVTILFVQAVTGFFAHGYLEDTRPDLVTEGYLEGLYSLLQTWGSAAMFVGGAIASYVVAGYLAAKLCPNNFQSPYGHAAAGAFVFCMIGTLIIQILLVCKCGTTPTQEDIGWAVLGFPPFVLLSLSGAWFGRRIRLLRSVDSVFKTAARASRQISRAESTEPVEGDTIIKPKDLDSEIEQGALNDTRAAGAIRHRLKRRKKRRRR
jgi:hypothetical protein